jgi:short-subunit dehydrogenase
MTVLITGASSGIGAATARLLAEQGQTVGIVGRRADQLGAVLAACQAHAPDSRMWVADLGVLTAAERIAGEAWHQFDGLDVLINNAAIPKRRAITELTTAEVEEVMRINFLSPARMTLRVLPRMLARGDGVIVNVASLGGRLGIPHEAAYCASKFALCGWSEAMALDLHGTGVNGPIDTDIWERPGEDPALFDIPKEPPETVAKGIVAAIRSDRFEHYLPDLKNSVRHQDSDLDEYIAGLASMMEGSAE